MTMQRTMKLYRLPEVRFPDYTLTGLFYDLHTFELLYPTWTPFVPSAGPQDVGSAADDQEGRAGRVPPSARVPEPVQPGARHEPGGGVPLVAAP